MSTTVTTNASYPSRVIIKNVRIAFPALNEPRELAIAPGSRPQYSGVFFVPETETVAIQAIQAAMWAAVSAKFGDKATLKWAQMQANNKLPLKNGALKADQEGFAGNLYLSASTKESTPPKLLDIFEDAPGSGRPVVLTRPQNRIYMGCYVNLEVNFWVYTNIAEGVSCDLLLVQFAKDGERFGGGVMSGDVSAFGAVPMPTAAIGATAFAAPAAPPAPAFAAPAASAFAAPAAPAAPAFAAPAAPGFPQVGVPSTAQFAVPSPF